MAKVFYLKMTSEMHQKINILGWGSEVGKKYLGLKYGELSAADHPESFEKAAELPGNDPEKVWMSLQNMDVSWTQREDTTAFAFTQFPRSMDVGDIVITDDGRAHQVLSVGFCEVRLTEEWISTASHNGEKK